MKKLECSKQALSLNTPAWNNRIGRWSYFVGLRISSNDEEGQLGALVFGSQR